MQVSKKCENNVKTVRMRRIGLLTLYAAGAGTRAQWRHTPDHWEREKGGGGQREMSKRRGWEERIGGHKLCCLVAAAAVPSAVWPSAHSCTSRFSRPTTSLSSSTTRLAPSEGSSRSLALNTQMDEFKSRLSQ